MWHSYTIVLEVSHRCALRRHSCKTLCPGIADPIAAEIKVSQRWALRQHSCKTLCPGCADLIAEEIEVRQRCALRQHSCKPQALPRLLRNYNCP